MRAVADSLQRDIAAASSSAFVFLAVALLGAYELSGLILTNDVISLSLVGMVCVAGAFVLAILRNWRHGVYCLIAWLLFEDFVRKYAGNNMAIYFAKDILTAVVYLSFFLAYRRRDKDLVVARPPFLPALLVFIWFGVLQIFNPGSTTVFFGLMGMKLYFYYTPLFLIGYSLINSEKSLQRFFYFNLGFGVADRDPWHRSVRDRPVVSQSHRGRRRHSLAEPDLPRCANFRRDHLSPHLGLRQHRPFRQHARRFVDDCLWFQRLHADAHSLGNRKRFFVFLALALIAAGCVMASSRGVFMWTMGSSIVGAAAFIWGAPWRQGEARRIIKTLQRASLGIALGMAVLFWIFPDAFMNRLKVYSETLDPRSPANELLHRTRDYPWQNFMGAFASDRWPYGFGIGTASLGGQYVTRIFQVAAPTETVESGFGMPRLGVGHCRIGLVVRHERRRLDLRVESRSQTSRLAVVPARIHDFLVRVSSASSVHLPGHAGLSGLRLERLPLALARHFVPPADTALFRAASRAPPTAPPLMFLSSTPAPYASGNI